MAFLVGMLGLTCRRALNAKEDKDEKNNALFNTTGFTIGRLR